MSKFFIPLLLLFAQVFAENKPPTVIEVELTEKETKKDPYKDQQNEVISIFESLAKAVDQQSPQKIATTGGAGIIPENLLLYLNSAYLYCMIAQGTCKEMLDSILEIDILNSLADNKATCLNMLRFWKSWLDNDMEKRHEHHTKIVHVNQVIKFNKEVRPQYTSCTKTVEGLLSFQAKDQSDQDFLKQRYSKLKENYAQKSLDFLKNIQEKVPNIYHEVGLKK